ncbi:hypothetical protein B0J14DRAFT_705635 [Halenospora varia]|nr:hypothetical protein B0J14DRAFT_705635 [Halenospora varia]
MALRTQEEANIGNGSPPPESSVRDFAVATDTAAEPIAEHTVDASAAVLTAVQDLGRGPSPSEEIVLTAEPDYVSYFGQKTQVTQLQALRTILWRMLRSRHLTLQIETLEVLPHMVDGIVGKYVADASQQNLRSEPVLTSSIEHMKQQETIQKNMQERINLLEGENVMLRGLQENLHRLQTDYMGVGSFIERLMKENQGLNKKWRDLETTVIRFEYSNQTLRVDNERLKEELNAVTGIPDGDTESDTGGPSKKRSRRDVTVQATSGDENESDTEGRSEKRSLKYLCLTGVVFRLVGSDAIVAWNVSRLASLTLNECPEVGGFLTTSTDIAQLTLKSFELVAYRKPLGSPDTLDAFLRSFQSLRRLHLSIDARSLNKDTIWRSIAHYQSTLRELVLNVNQSSSDIPFNGVTLPDIDTDTLQLELDFLGLNCRLSDAKSRCHLIPVGQKLRMIHIRRGLSDGCLDLINDKYDVARDLDEFGNWVFGPKGLPNLDFIAYGNFTALSRSGSSREVFRRGGRPPTASSDHRGEPQVRYEKLPYSIPG